MQRRLSRPSLMEAAYSSAKALTRAKKLQLNSSLLSVPLIPSQRFFVSAKDRLALRKKMMSFLISFNPDF